MDLMVRHQYLNTIAILKFNFGSVSSKVYLLYYLCFNILTVVCVCVLK